MWLCEGEDVTSDSEVQQPTTLRPSVQGGAHPAAIGSVRWVYVGTARAMEEVKRKWIDAIYR